ncbi:MAG TPA: SDR family oxidoreductase [Ruminiclostridium sp.]
MKILMIGGTGNISTAATELLLKQGHDLYLYCRGSGDYKEFIMKGATIQYGDINDEVSVQSFLGKHTFDVIIDWIIFTPEQAKRDIRLFMGKTTQYIFVSSASAYQRPSKNYLVTEDMPLENPYWEYSCNKIECEKIMMEAYKKDGFPVTIVRPSLTYGDTIIPYVLVSWLKPWSLIDRMRKGKRIIVPGDGTSLWVITHNTDFAKGIVGLMGKEKAIGEAFHITSDEVMTWDEVLNQIAEVIGVEPKPVHISSEFIVAFMPDQLGNLNGDKISSVVFDNSKLKSVALEFEATMSFKEGIAKTFAYLESHPELQVIDTEYEENTDRIIAAHDYGMSLAKKD